MIAWTTFRRRWARVGLPPGAWKREHLTPAYIRAFIGRVRRIATVIDPVGDFFAYERDPNDEPYLNLAIASEAVYLVSRDRDLLDLQDPASLAGQQLRILAPRPTILDPVPLLQLLELEQQQPG